jgi:chemotaxis receptor (MCP) glutamine deamidase CheD
MLSGLMRTRDDIAGGQPVFGRQDSLHIGSQNMKQKVKRQFRNFELLFNNI